MEHSGVDDLDDLWNAVVCFQPHSLLIGNVWVPVMHFCFKVAKVHWRVGSRLGSCRLISVQPLIGLTINAFAIVSALWVLAILCCQYWHRFCQTDPNTLWWMVVGVNWLMLLSGVQQGSVLGPLLFLLYTSELFSILENKPTGYAGS